MSQTCYLVINILGCGYSFMSNIFGWNISNKEYYDRNKIIIEFHLEHEQQNNILFVFELWSHTFYYAPTKKLWTPYKPSWKTNEINHIAEFCHKLEQLHKLNGSVDSFFGIFQILGIKQGSLEVS